MKIKNIYYLLFIIMFSFKIESNCIIGTWTSLSKNDEYISNKITFRDNGEFQQTIFLHEEFDQDSLRFTGIYSINQNELNFKYKESEEIIKHEIIKINNKKMI